MTLVVQAAQVVEEQDMWGGRQEHRMEASEAAAILNAPAGYLEACRLAQLTTEVQKHVGVGLLQMHRKAVQRAQQSQPHLLALCPEED